MGLLTEFKEFAVKGNMIDMAVGIIIGTAFNNVVTTIVDKVFLPPLSMLTDDVNFANRKWVLREGVEAVSGSGTTPTPGTEEIAIGYGELLQVSIDFVIIGFTVFLVIKLMNKLRNRAQDPKNPEVVTPKDIELLNDLKELMEEQNKILSRK
ncbi:large conductance mechanosensitive channel [Nonlabens sp. Hel1_33_55]|uniref:large conductance mechanosensitive channel protein MscL n=1 Tax=Nonlabens sp. Hel1_33_55 TaxID=1336802 RepID=UPI000875AF01|nr:large conductance mechanosensitive channel protein MscL [Nonlabens sp. Hel1_33_55]SCY08887.1 large conductance mechanosensitive channel [Nonlabens sp. Hel1_33_55]